MGHNGHRIDLYGVVVIPMASLHAGGQYNLEYLSLLHWSYHDIKLMC